MDYTTTVLITLVIYKIILIGIGFWSNKKTNSTEDYFIGSRGLGPWVAAISSAASASSAWTLLGVSGAAYAMGLSAIWLVPAVLSGYLINWLWLAPRIQKKAQAEQAVTLTDILSKGSGKLTKPIVWFCSFCIVFCFTFYVAAQFQAAGTTFASTFDVSMTSSIVMGTTIILIYTLLGGFWAVSITDTLQGTLMALASIVLPVAGLIAVGGFGELWQGMNEVFTSTQMNITGEHTGFVALAFVFGLGAIGLGQSGQPHVVNRMMALRDEKAVQQAKVIAIGWATIVIVGMLIVGWCAKVLLVAEVSNEQALLAVTNMLFPPVVAGVIIAAILSAIMSTADSQLLVSASAMSYDVIDNKNDSRSLYFSRLTVVIMCIISMLLALYAPEDIFSRVLFAWNALGAAFGPLLIVKVISKSVDGRYAFCAIFTGFALSVILSLFPSAPGDYLERIVPFALAFIIAWLGRR